MKEVEGNLLALANKGQFDVIGHGCNTYNTMGAGIAKQIKEEFPRAFAADRDYYQLMRRQFPTTYHSLMLGRFSVANYAKLSILNIYSQLSPGPDFRTGALIAACKEINSIYKGLRIGLPLIGAGIGGGNKEITLLIYETYLKKVDLTVVHYKP